MGEKITKIILSLGALFGFFLKADFVLALEANYPPLFGQSVTDTSDIAAYGCYIIAAILNLAVIIATIAIAYGGIYYLISYGRGKFTSEAKDIIKSAILGLLIIVCATLIAHTINPNLTSCKIGVLSFIGLDTSGNSKINPYNAPVVTYKKIPLGTLTETLLTRTMGCYGFDEEGNPIDGEEITTDEGKKGALPTYTNHDRADCLLQLIDGANKKAQVVAALSTEITKLMNLCDCKKYGECKPKCNPITGCQYTSCPGGSCVGECVGGACLITPSIPDCCPAESGVNDPKTGKELTVKEQIENGPVPVEVDVGSVTGDDSCKTQEKKFMGLDEFRCPNTIKGDEATKNFCDGLSIKNFVEKLIYINNITRAVISKDRWEQLSPKDQLLFTPYTIIDQKKWGQLNLTQQLIYFKEKIDFLKEKIRADQSVLTQARDTLQDRQCYLAKSSVDFFRIYATTDQKKEFISINKPFSDPETNQKVSATKYCDGFNYNNSSCFKKCNDECPDTSGKALEAYSKVKDCTGKPYSSSCWSDQKSDIRSAFGKRPCTLGDDTKQTYNGCISSCQNDCSNICAKKYITCSNDYKTCEEQCNNNSQCILDNSDKCLLDAQAFRNCSSNTSDPANTDNCIDKAYLCKNGSDQYAGYPDCINSSFSSSSSLSSNCPTDQYSASYFYENPDCQKCKNPYETASPGSVCLVDGKNNTPNYPQNNDEGKFCQDVCPETSKCSTASFCPDCPCDDIKDQAFRFIIPQESTKDNAGNAGYSIREEKVSDDLSHQIVGPECNTYSYNDDPLTFYCQDEWWNNSKREGLNQIPIGAQRICLPGGEVPVGQTIDSAQNWANNLITSADKMKQSIENILTQMYKAGKAKDTDTPPVKDYCKCNAKFESSLPICKTDCNYDERLVPIFDEYGDVVGEEWQCSCAQAPCEGNPCEQVVDYLSQIWNNYRQFKLNFIDFYITTTTEPRSDIVKELTYSRSQINKCSLERNIYGTRSRLLSCTRVEDEIILPAVEGPVILGGGKVDGYCYGKNLDQNLTDNWFCCQEYSKDELDSKPIDQDVLP